MENFSLREKSSPLLFVGHGNPMYAIEESMFADNWKNLGNSLPRPEAILCISAHWESHGTFVSSIEKPDTIHDFYGFPEELFKVQYPAKGAPLLAVITKGIIKLAETELDAYRGLDHGCWAILKHIYPDASIPVVQLSIAMGRSPEWHYELGKELKELRKRGVMVIGSGNIVHNLRSADWRNKENIYPWAEEFNSEVKKHILTGGDDKLTNYNSIGTSASLSVPTNEHYLPLLYILAMREKNEEVKFFNDKIEMGSISMTSMIIG